jgi:hypothetical protein
MNNNAQKIERLKDIYRKLYANEPADTYDLDAAEEYWANLSGTELDAELRYAILYPGEANA